MTYDLDIRHKIDRRQTRDVNNTSALKIEDAACQIKRHEDCTLDKLYDKG